MCRTLVDIYDDVYEQTKKHKITFFPSYYYLSCFFFFCLNGTAHTSFNCLFIFSNQSVNQGGDQELENLVTKLAILKDLLSSIEKKVQAYIQSRVGTHSHT